MKKVLIIASGGGHTGHSVALAQYLVDLGVEAEFVVPENDLWTRSSVRPYGEIVAETPKFLDPKDPLYLSLFKAPPAIIKSIKRIRGRYKIVVASGSNHSISSAISAWLKGSDIVSFEATERFLEPSRTIKILGGISKIVAFQWEEQKKFNPRGLVVGPFLGKVKYNAKDEGYILVTAGSYGYKKLFDEISKTDLKDVILQTGKVDPNQYKNSHKEWKAFNFDPDIERFIAHASVVITHFGRTAVESAIKYRKPTILSPNIEWKWMKNDIRLKESEIMAKKINAYYLRPDEVSRENILNAIEKVKKMSPPFYEDGAKKLADIIYSML